MNRPGAFANFLVLVLVCAMGMVLIGNVKWSARWRIERRGSDLLDGCRHVYLDVGSNIGVQVRKLYQPELYPGAGILPVFKEAFGNDDLSTICTVGFEPNPSHSGVLREIQEAYSDCGWPVHFFTETAVSNYSGVAEFYTDNETDYHEWGAGIVSGNNNLVGKPKSLVNALRLSEFIHSTVAGRILPNHAKRGRPNSQTRPRPPTVIMKMDIEGSEVEVLTDLLLTGAMAHIDATMVEFHTRLAQDEKRKKLSKMLELGLKALTSISPLLKHLTLDDETYGSGGSRKPLPSCKRK